MPSQGMTLELHRSLDAAARRRFAASLLRWYDHNRRDLPWRRTKDPYLVWVSEIMLQQTRVAAVLNYYGRFVEQFPTIEALAEARLESVLAAWSGLGYYRRARALHAAARLLVRDHNHRLPPTAIELRNVPGIGRYTAAAIASIAFGERCGVVDGNVQRVLERVSGATISTAQAWQMADALAPAARPGDFNQAMMELGATVCLPGKPLCAQCPVRRFCACRSALPTRRRAPAERREIAYALSVKDS